MWTVFRKQRWSISHERRSLHDQGLSLTESGQARIDRLHISRAVHPDVAGVQVQGAERNPLDLHRALPGADTRLEREWQ